MAVLASKRRISSLRTFCPFLGLYCNPDFMGVLNTGITRHFHRISMRETETWHRAKEMQEEGNVEEV